MSSIRIIGLCVAFSLLFSGCVSSKGKRVQPSPKPRVIAVTETPGLCCWYAEGPKGQKGYACVDSRLNGFWVEGGGLFETILELHNALDVLGLTHVPIERFPQRPPDGWKVRALTAEELRILRAN